MILHFCSTAAWEAAREAGSYRADTLDGQGFIHLSTARQVHVPATFLVRGRTDQVLLEVDETRLDAELRWEPGDPPNAELDPFPHLYGPLNLDAVVAVHPFPPNADGSFTLPAALANRGLELLTLSSSVASGPQMSAWQGGASPAYRGSKQERRQRRQRLLRQAQSSFEFSSGGRAAGNGAS